jgi:hypothetical protein
MQVGDIVHYFPGKGSAPLAAIVSHVTDEHTVNLAAITVTGQVHGHVSVCVGEAEEGPYCVWAVPLDGHVSISTCPNDDHVSISTCPHDE